MSQLFRSAEVALDTGTGQVTRAGSRLQLEPRTLEVLLFLLQRPGQLVHHQDLLDGVWTGTAVTPHSLTQAVSQLRHSLGDDPARPRFIETVHRRGYRWIAPVEVQESPALQDRPSAMGRWRLPAPAVTLVGRDALIESVGSALRESRLVVLVGPGGVGKTQLALEAGRRIADRFQHGVLLVDLTAEVDERGVSRALARELRIDPGGDGTWLGAITPMIRDRSALLLLDNCERVADAVTSLASRLLAACPGLRILATTQRHLGAPGQVLVRVPPLDTPAPGSPDVNVADPSGWPAAVRLFVDRARAVNPDFSLSARNAGAVGEICRRLDGIPFAIELAAARANVLTPAEIAQRLDERFQLLTTRHPATLSRHEALHQALSWSTSLLAEPSRRLLERLAVFSRGWTLDAARAVVDLPGDSVVDDLAGLVDKSLVAVEVGGEQARFRLLDSIHLYLRDRLAGSPDHVTVRERHLQHYCGFAASVEREISRNPLPWLRRVREEHANLRDALAWAVATPGSGEAGLRLCCDLRWAWRIEGNYLEPREWLTQLLTRVPDATPSLAGRSWIVLGLTQQHRGELSDARTSTRRGLDLLPPEERWERYFGELLLALIETLAGDLDAAAAVAGRAEREMSPLADDRLEAFSLVRAALAAGIRGRHADAVRLLTRAGDHLGRESDPFLLTFTKVQLGLQHYLAGDPAPARVAAVEAMRAGFELDNLRAMAGGIEVLAYLAIEDGEARWAGRLLGAAARLREITAAPMLRNFGPSNRRARARLDELLGPERAARTIDEGAGALLEDLLGTFLRQS